MNNHGDFMCIYICPFYHMAPLASLGRPPAGSTGERGTPAETLRVGAPFVRFYGRPAVGWEPFMSVLVQVLAD